ncbi:30S ribosomal protein S8 [soil metagenome]
MDHISNLITSIRNAELVGHASLTAPYSNLSASVLKVLKENGYIKEYSTKKVEGFDRLSISLPEPVTRHTYKRISTPGRRLYTPVDKIPTVLRGLGIVVISTPKGVMTGKQARKENVGGELMFQAY